MIVYQPSWRKFSVPLPPANVECFETLNAIENGLRELIIEELQNISGPRWYKCRLPGDVLKKYQEAVELQRRVAWAMLVPHHPLYYVDFPDLKKIMEREDNWKEAFQPVFGRKDIVSATLSELEPIRNAIAHNRRVTDQDQAIVEGAFAKLMNAIGEDRLSGFLSKLTTATGISENLIGLASELKATLNKCKNFQPLSPLVTWPLVSRQWWFDESYLGISLEPVESCFSVFSEYAKLPRPRGGGHVLERWICSSNIDEKAKQACRVLAILSPTGEGKK